MIADFDDTLPAALTVVHSRPLFVMRLDVRPYQIIGGPDGAFRRIGVVPGGRFSGARLSGTVLEGGRDWQIVRQDGSVTLDVRLVLETSDGANIGMTYKGIRYGSPEVLGRLDRGEPVDPASYYFRITALFETASGHGWLNNLVAIGIGHRTSENIVYSLFEIL